MEVVTGLIEETFTLLKKLLPEHKKASSNLLENKRSQRKPRRTAPASYQTCNWEHLWTIKDQWGCQMTAATSVTAGENSRKTVWPNPEQITEWEYTNFFFEPLRFEDNDSINNKHEK